MNKLIMTKGLPASGKSTWASLEVNNSGGNTKRVNKDDLRAMVDNSAWSREREREILKIRDYLINHWLETGYNVIVDDTNLAPKHETSLRSIANSHGADFEIKDFTEVPVKVCMERDAYRDNPVGNKVIMNMYYTYLFDNSKWLTKPALPGVKSKPAVVLVDIDGTIAIHNGRNPYDLTKVKEDLFNEKLWAIIKHLPYHVIFLSGREGTEQCMRDTVDWMHRCTGDETVSDKYEFIFRNEGDHRNDSIVKKELYEAFVEPIYNVVAVYDDRDRVVDMWRSLGLFTCQVNYGAF